MSNKLETDLTVYVWNEPYGIRKFTPAYHNAREHDTAIEYVTIDRAEAYKDACVREALEDAYNSARGVEEDLLQDHLQSVSAPAAASYVANRIRALIPNTETKT